MTGNDDADRDGGVETTHRNEVVVVGRLSSPALSREMPSGDVLTSWRLVVDRSAAARRRGDGGKGRDFDVIDCVTASKRLRTTVTRWAIGDIVEVDGALRKRYWRAGGALQSRCEIEASRAVRVQAVDGAVRRRRKTG